MNKIRSMLGQPEFHGLLFVVFFVLICLPFLIFSGKNGIVNMFDLDMFVYFFSVWGALIVLLFFVAISLRRTDPSPDPAEKGRDSDV